MLNSNKCNRRLRATGDGSQIVAFPICLIIMVFTKYQGVIAMARCARKKSKSNIYHIMLRGINRMNIFLDDDDRTRFLQIVDRMGKEDEYKIQAYCLMDNHVHLLIKEARDPLQKSLKRIGVSYAYYFNKKYSRIGHVFQDRYRSEAIEDDIYLISVTRYIHNNPVKAGIAEKAANCRWSSYNKYLEPWKVKGPFDTQTVLGIYSDDESTAIRYFKKFTAESTNEEFIDMDNNAEKPERLAGNEIGTVEELIKAHGYRLDDVRNFKDKVKRNELLRTIKKNSSMSVRELSRVLGISKDIIFRA